MVGCLDDNAIVAFVTGIGDEDGGARSMHIDECSECPDAGRGSTGNTYDVAILARLARHWSSAITRRGHDEWLSSIVARRLESRAARIPDEALRASYLAGVAAHRRVSELLAEAAGR